MVRFGTGRYPKKHYYTVQNIADITGRAVGTIRNDSSAGKIDLDSLESVVCYCSWIGRQRRTV